MRSIKTKIILLTLSIFYDIVFIDRFWTSPKLNRAYVGLLGIIIAGSSGIVYFINRSFSTNVPPLIYDLAIIIGAVLFIFGGFGKRLIFSFDVSSSLDYLKSLRTIICFTSNTLQSSAIIEVIISYIGSRGLSSLKSSDTILQFAYDIWIESLMNRGLQIFERSFPKLEKSKYYRERI
ncbi:MAG: hypothetical protein NZ922_00545 [Candidatus Methanomethyliaceae archaeon]|nr:hypothetical protein [Candidatus Methanomethyliaceae archaeon]MDW7970437.1 hypothetical protein [Nitrososphaerota archaeon]